MKKRMLTLVLSNPVLSGCKSAEKVVQEFNEGTTKLKESAEELNKTVDNLERVMDKAPEVSKQVLENYEEAVNYSGVVVVVVVAICLSMFLGAIWFKKKYIK